MDELTEAARVNRPGLTRRPLYHHSTLHHGTANTSGVIHFIVFPVCNNSPARVLLPYSDLKVRRCLVSLRRGLLDALISIGSNRPPVSITKSISSPIVVRQ
jgi:hypothetical protein